MKKSEKLLGGGGGEGRRRGREGREGKRERRRGGPYLGLSLTMHIRQKPNPSCETVPLIDHFSPLFCLICTFFRNGKLCTAY